MNDPLRVRRLQTTRRLDHAIEGLIHRQDTVFAGEAIEVVSLDVIHRHERNAAVLIGIEHRDDVGMATAGRRL